MREARKDNPQTPREHPRHKNHGDVADGPDAPVEHHYQQQRERARDSTRAPGRQAGHEVIEIARKADAAARHRQGRGKHNLPDHEKRQPASGALRTVSLAQIVVAAAGLRHRRSELRPDQPVRKSHQRPDKPAEHRLRPTHSGEQERNGDVGADPYHVGDGQRRRLD